MRDLGPAGEAAWQTLRQHAEWAEGVWFGWVFVAAPLAVEELVARLDSMADVRGPSLVVPLTDVEGVLTSVLGDSARNRRAVWIVGQGLDPAEWERLHLRLNERRERLRRHLAGPLILLGRPEWKEVARTAAPDLWSQRTVVVEWVPEVGLVVPEREVPRWEPDRHVPDAALAARGIGRAIARGDAEAETEARVRLSEAHLAAGRPADARDEGIAAVAQAPPGGVVRARAYAAAAEAEAALGDLAGASAHYGLALQEPLAAGEDAAWWGLKRGRVLVEAGRLDEAQRAFMDASRRATNTRTLSLVLLDLGQVTHALGDWEEAQRAFKQALELGRQRRELEGDTTDVLRQLALALDGVGGAARTRGDYQGAAASLSEALAKVRELRAALGDEPEVLRDLVVALNQVGRIAFEVGDLEAAGSAFAEALAVGRSLRAIVGETPTVLRDLSVVLNRLGLVLQETGDLSAAFATLSESLELRRRLRASRGERPTEVRDVSVSLDFVGEIARRRNDFAVAKAAFAESLALCRQLRVACGDLPHVFHDLAISLLRLHSVTPDPSLLSEALSLATEMHERWPSNHTEEFLTHVRAVASEPGSLP